VRLIRATAYIKKFVDLCRKREKRVVSSRELTVGDIEWAERQWLSAT